MDGRGLGDGFAAAFRALFVLGMLGGLAVAGLLWGLAAAWRAWGPTITVGW